MQTAEAGIGHIYGSLAPEQRVALRDMLLKWLRSVGGKLEATFIRNKIAQMLVTLFQFEYPAVWPSFFTDLIELLPVCTSAEWFHSSHFFISERRYGR